MVWRIVAGVGALVVAVLVARPLGRALEGRSSSWFWIANAVILIAAIVLAVVSALSRNDVLWGVALGIGFGGLAGLRYGRKGLFSAGSEIRT